MATGILLKRRGGGGGIRGVVLLSPEASLIRGSLLVSILPLRPALVSLPLAGASPILTLSPLPVPISVKLFHIGVEGYGVLSSLY